MVRPPMQRGLLWIMFLLAASMPALGCRSLLTTAVYLFKGTDVDPDYAGLKGKKVAVVCRPLVNLQYRNANAHRDLAEQITTLLKEKVPKIKIIEQRKVAKWTDENTWEEFPEVGKALKADLVVGVDLESFSIFQGQTLYQGKANAVVRVYDCRDGNKKVFEKTVPQAVYPPSGGIPTSERQESEFRHEFVMVLADQIARHFYAHDPYADVGLDAAALR
jgi:hypothetical protein